MRILLIAAAIISLSRLTAQTHASNIIVITTDGFRWQELFRGADSLLIRDPAYVQDTSLMIEQFWGNDIYERRKKLMPFFWNIISKKGRLAGNRDYGNKVLVSNFFKISYPGYNEIMTGYPDPLLIPNLRINNRNENVLAFLNAQPPFTGKVVAFSSWSVMPNILNEKKSGIPVNSGYERLDDTDAASKLINAVQEAAAPSGTREDLLTYASARNYMEQQHPRVVFLSFGETDECAHQGRYDAYLLKAHQFDQLVADLWNFLQMDPFYRNNTCILLTTDHGRGSKTNQWKDHGFWIRGSGQTWLAMLGKGILPAGEERQPATVYEKQIAATIGSIL
ncbi:MAG TPA: alkaline phosphatase family protein, partial [Sediminibacterium sp.]|nr:alkaline phosphatase family protein [Sediminibacterium sp.]